MPSQPFTSKAHHDCNCNLLMLSDWANCWSQGWLEIIQLMFWRTFFAFCVKGTSWDITMGHHNVAKHRRPHEEPPCGSDLVCPHPPGLVRLPRVWSLVLNQNAGTPLDKGQGNQRVIPQPSCDITQVQRVRKHHVLKSKFRLEIKCLWVKWKHNVNQM